MAASFERNGINPSAHPHFIKILSPKSLIMLAIPRNFVKHLANSELKTATLVSPCHTFWHVQVLHNQDDKLDMQFGRGWELFVRAHRLKPGDAILFRYEGNTVFSVKLFHSDGCCVWCDCNDLDSAPRCIVQDLTVNHESFKQATNIANKERKKNSENTGVKAKVSQKRVRKKDKQLSRFEWILRSYNVDQARAQIYLPYLPQGLVSAVKSEIISLDCLGRLWPVRLWVGKQMAITTGWKQLVRETKLEEGDKCVFETISQGVLGLKIERKT
ncbi:putative B3 domain-containing protein Os04g0347400 [Zingiber officinale]|uniref:putative B3 domain-containing protein Os04g0347400 n=1 Tax=Zingiber officinale TaxID=94328 RepID=UPI001C4D71C5|nr:putative B3 domain-containing protein Os04g0347400 [Zingiber officinale]XP_042375175.1 putative B3 domain-containing protein Os04g0347400 [Zingiber officinale]XP_042375176.1 putative B3 domain-containing protein Os04g0347400 [Zingiber officinale]XP_042375177.1 putative B3 domain-containing protein Os04g0347400 [Zingiber officinale]